MAFSPEGRWIVTGSVDNTAKIWDAATGQEALTLKGHTNSIYGVAFSPDGKRVATAGDFSARVWDARNGQQLLNLEGHTKDGRTTSVYSVAFSPDGKRLVIAANRAINVRDADTGREILTVEGHTEAVSAVAFSPDGKRILSASGDSTGKAWDSETGEELLTLNGHSGGLSSIAVSPDARRIVTGSSDGTAKVWDTATGREVRTIVFCARISPVGDHNVRCAVFSPDGKLIVTGANSLNGKLWDAETGSEIPLQGLKIGTPVAFSPDGKRIVMGDGGMTRNAVVVPFPFPKAPPARPGKGPNPTTTTTHSPTQSSEFVSFPCPNCHKVLKAKHELAGRKCKCPKCGVTVQVPAVGEVRLPSDSANKPVGTGEASPERSTAPDWEKLLVCLRDRRPAEISTVREAAAVAVIVPYYEAVVADEACPKLTYYLLKATNTSATGTFPYLVVKIGEQTEHDKAWNFNYEAILKRALPGKTWDDFTWGGGHSNHSKPGCQLASTAGFDRLATTISQGGYQIDRVFGPGIPRQPSLVGSADGAKSYRWDVKVFGEEIVCPELACQFCGENRVAFGQHGSHLSCRSCGAIYCRRNCQASINGQCPRCGEADRIDAVSEAPAPTRHLREVGCCPGTRRSARSVEAPCPTTGRRWGNDRR